jgi:hypothetical protein
MVDSSLVDALPEQPHAVVLGLVTASLWAAIYDKSHSRDDVAEAYAERLRVAGSESGWKSFNEAIIERWSKSGLAYIKENVWKIARAKS